MTFVALLAWSAGACALPVTDGRALDSARFDFDSWLAILLASSALLYLWGVASLWRKAGIGRGIRKRDVLCFALGFAVLAFALLSPIDERAHESFAVHMVQHELLMILAAPLLVLARPLEAWAWALPPRARAAIAVATRSSAIRLAWAGFTAPLGAWCVHALSLWLWHVPAAFIAALEHPSLHVLQHASFFVSALAFWWAVYGGRTRAPDARSLAALFTTMLHTSALGALLAFAPEPWYAYDATRSIWGLAPLEDQQLGGLVMWVPGSLSYLVAGLVIAGSWLSSPRVRGLAR